jgi:MoaA/NifB/PqqE/SkfB family radical SAM enzyme
VGLDPGTLAAALTHARALGFGTVAVSGGEPLLWPALPEVLGHARALGMRVTVTTNGTLLRGRRLAALCEVADAVALSVDGPPELHDTVRARPGAFRRLADGLLRLRETGVPFGIIHTLTERSWPHLPWVADFAAEQGAALLQLHPLELAGRAATAMPGDAARQDTLGRAFLVSQALAADFAGRMNVQLDLVLRQDLLADPARFLMDGGPEHLRTLVVEPDGAVVPVTYGLDRAYAIANLADESLADGWARWATAGWPALQALGREVVDAIAAAPNQRVVEWHALLLRQSLTGRRANPPSGRPLPGQ